MLLLRFTRVRHSLLACAFVSCATFAAAQTPSSSSSSLDLKKVSLEQLMNIEVTSVSRSEEPLSSVPAALTVVTSDDIRRSGATTVPEALRGVPGIQVARERSDAWALSSRGFSSVNSEKLLVLSDTRSIYTPLVSGVFWAVQDYLLHDIDRIEVIRGPGASLWGSNAVNGVINITTKSAKDTQGLYIETAAGTEERATLAARFGGTLGERGYYRVFGKYFDRDASRVPAGLSPDDWNMGHGGFRADWESTPRDTLTVQGDVYRGEVGLIAPSFMIIGRSQQHDGPLRAQLGGGNVLGRWRHRSSNQRDLQVRVYYDRTHRDDPSYVDTLNTFDADVQQRVAIGRRHELTGGVNYRVTDSTNTGKGIFNLDPPSSRDQLFSGFIQDQIRITDRLRVTAGTKLEHNDFSGSELQPTVRVAWEVRPRSLVWGSVSRAVRVPTRIERDVAVDVAELAPDTIARLVGNDDFDSEKLVAFEAGYRWQALPTLVVDAAAFHNRYTGLASLELGTPAIDPGDGRTVIPIVNRNLNDGHSSGLEIQVTIDPTPTWRVSASSSTLGIDITPGGQDLNRSAFLDGASPRHQLAIQSTLDLPHRVQVDALLWHVTKLRRLPQSVTGEGVPAYAELNTRLAWRAWTHAELSVVGQNLLHADHPEFGVAASRGNTQRAVYASVAWGF
jgi:iron complex outermembrane receptor protein